MPRLFSTTTSALVIVGALSAAPAAEAQLFYDVDFSSPTHTVGQPPTTGGGPPPRDTVSSIVFGDPTVVTAVGALNDQPCEFRSVDGTTDQFLLQLDDLPADTKYRLKCKVIFISGTSNFTILFDTPQVRNIHFQPNGTVRIFVPGGSNKVIGNYMIGQVVELQVDVDFDADNWEIRLDGTLAHSGAFGAATELRSIRYSLPQAALAGVDDIEITAGEIDKECPEDLDGNGAVDFGDILRILTAWGPCP